MALYMAIHIALYMAIAHIIASQNLTLVIIWPIPIHPSAVKILRMKFRTIYNFALNFRYNL